MKSSTLVILLLLITTYNTPEAKDITSSKEKYLSQTLVDSSIQRAFYILNEAANTAGVGFKQRDAINEARQISISLKQKAKGDPNERYVLWKVGELEAQLYLEEKDLMLQQMQKGLITVNQLIARYNGEVGKDRPDFSSMRRLHIQISTLDSKKANEMADSYNKRYRAISREVLFSLEKAIMKGDLDPARDELGYCLRNRTYLQIPDSKYTQLENQVEGLTKARLETPLIITENKDALTALYKNDIQTSREKVTSARNRLISIKNNLPQSETAALTLNLDGTSRRISTKEDSLVQLNLTILKNNGVIDANKFLQTTLRTYGVSREKIAYVDQTILSISSPDDGRMTSEIGEIADNEDIENESSSLDLIRAAAKKKAQIKMDSLRAIEDERLRKEQVENARLDSIFRITQFDLQKNQDKAVNISIELYTLMEQNQQSKALSNFKKDQQFLTKYMPKDAYDMLSFSLNQSPIEQTPETKSTIAYISSQTESAPSNPDDEKMRVNQEKAQQEIVDLYTMLENNNTQTAYNRFYKIRITLMKYLDKDVFDILETTIMQAHASTSR
jgi:hypothetical protein